MDENGSTSLGFVLEEICAERAEQDAQWGGPTHDDSHRVRDWFTFIERQIDLARSAQVDQNGRREATGGYLHVPEVRSRLVKIAALAVAGVESIDRTNGRGDVA